MPTSRDMEVDLKSLVQDTPSLRISISHESCFSTFRAHVLFCFSQNRQPHTRDQRPKKSALVLSLRAEYTRLRDQKNILNTRGTRNGNGFRPRSREKGGPGIALLSTSAVPALSCRCGLVGTAVDYKSNMPGSNPVSDTTFLLLFLRSS